MSKTPLTTSLKHNYIINSNVPLRKCCQCLNINLKGWRVKIVTKTQKSITPSLSHSMPLLYSNEISKSP